MTTLHDPLRSARWTVRFSLALAFAAIAMAIHAAFNPAVPSGRGLSGLALAILSAWVGPYADAVMWAAIAAVLLYFARLMWKHAPRVPGDRWWRLTSGRR